MGNDYWLASGRHSVDGITFASFTFDESWTDERIADRLRRAAECGDGSVFVQHGMGGLRGYKSAPKIQRTHGGPTTATVVSIFERTARGPEFDRMVVLAGG